MIKQSALPRKSGRQNLCLPGIDWKTYTRLLRTFAEKPGVRLTYDRGELEIMSPTLAHDDDGRILGLFVHVLTDEMNLPLKHGGATTLRRRLRRRGIEADECFWIANAPKMAGKRKLNLRTDPPPDLAIEVDVSHSTLNRLGIYAALKVPEVWNLEGDNLRFFILGSDGQYTQSSASLTFPMVTPQDLLTFLKLTREAGDENQVIRQFREWVRQRIGKNEN